MRFVGGQSDLFTGGAQLIAGHPLATSSQTASILPNITQGVAPMGVFFDATQSGFVAARPLHDLRFKWVFAASGTYDAVSADHPWGVDKTVAYGPRAAFVFDAPGNHVVTLEITDGTDTVRDTRVIQVSNPDTFFSGAKTYAISTGSFDDAPAGAVQVSNLMAARLDAQGNGRREVRFLFARGQSHDIGGGAGIFAGGQFDGMSFGSFGTGADPVISGGSIRTEGDAFAGAVSFEGLAFEGGFDPVNGTGNPGDGLLLTGAASHVVHRCAITGYGRAVVSDAGLDDVYISDTTITAWADDAIVFDSGDRMAVLGCSILPQAGTNPAHITGGPGRIEGANPGRAVIWHSEMQSVTTAPCWRWNADGATGSAGVVGACRMEGGSPVLEIAPSNPGGTDREGDLIVERNYLLGGAETGATGIVKLTFGGTSLRNNVAVLPDVAPASAVDATAFLTGAASQTNAANDAAPVRVHSNTFVDLRSTGTLANSATVFAETDASDFAHWTDLEVVNQLVHAPSLQTPVTPHAPLDETAVFVPRESGVPATSAGLFAPFAKPDGTDTVAAGSVAIDDFYGVVRGDVAERGAYEAPEILTLTAGGAGGILADGLVAGTAEFTVTTPGDLAGTFQLNIDDLRQGPVLLREPQIVGTFEPGSVVSAEPGVIAWDPKLGRPLVTYQWKRGSFEIEGETGLTYTVQAGDDTLGLFLDETAVNAGDATLSTTTTIVSAPSFTENRVNVNNAAHMQGNWDIGPASVDTVLLFSSYYYLGENAFVFWLPGGRVYTSGSRARQEFRVPYDATNNVRFHFPTDVVSGQRISSLMAAEHSTGRNTSYMKIDDGPWQMMEDRTGTSFSGTSWNLAQGSIDMFLGSTIDHVRTALFLPSSYPDLHSEGVRGLFVNADGTLQAPSQSISQFGTPTLDVYGTAADYVAGINHGSQPNFDLVEGTFTDV